MTCDGEDYYIMESGKTESLCHDSKATTHCIRDFHTGAIRIRWWWRTSTLPVAAQACLLTETKRVTKMRLFAKNFKVYDENTWLLKIFSENYLV